jgi:hypothetical protein
MKKFNSVSYGIVVESDMHLHLNFCNVTHFQYCYIYD